MPSPHWRPTSRVLALGVALLSQPFLASAQAGAGRLALVGDAQRAHITEDDGYLGAGWGGGAGVEYQVTSSLALGASVEAVHHVRDLDFFAIAHDPADRIVPLPFTERWKGTATFVMARLFRSFGADAGMARPIVWGGIGLMRHGGTTRGPLTMPEVPAGYSVQPGDLDVRVGRASVAPAFEGGAGVDVRTAARWSMRPYGAFRLAGTGNFGPKYIIRGGVQVTVR